MAKVIAYEYQINGVRKVITTQEQVTAAIKETNTELAKTDQGTEAYEDLNKQVAQLKNAQKDAREETKKTQLELIVAAEKGRNSWRGLTAELKLLQREYRDLDEAGRKTARGLEIADRLQEIRKEIKGINEETGQFSLGDTFKNALGDLGGFDITQFATIGGAISVVGAAAAEAAQFVGQSVNRFDELRNSVELLTGATGPQLDEFTSRVAAIADTFEQDQNEIARAADVASSQLNISYSEALDQIQTGFIAGSDLSGEFLQSLEQYPQFFNEAGLSADAFFKVANRQATEGITSDKGLDAVKEATLRLRELPQTTLDALEGIGFAANEIEAIINEEGIGGAIAAVSGRLGELEAQSPEVGAAIADIFGGAGEDAGLAFLTSLEDINDETASLLDTTTEYQQQQLRTLEVNQEFAEVQNEVAKALGGTGATISNVTTQIQTGLFRILQFVIERFQTFWATLQPVRDALTNLGIQLGLFTEQGERTQRFMNILNGILRAQEIAWELFGKAVGFVIDQVASFVGGIREALEWLGILDENAAAAASSTRDLEQATTESADASGKQADAQQKSTTQMQSATTATEKFTKATNDAAKATVEFADGSIAKLRQNLQDLEKQLLEAAPDQVNAILPKLLGAEQALEQAEELTNRLRFGIQQVEPLELLPPPEITGELVSETVSEIKDLVTTGTQEITRITADQVKTIADEIFGFIGQANQLATEASRQRFDFERRELEDRYQREIDLAQNDAQLKGQLEDDLAAERRRLDREEFEEQKKFQVAGALTSLASGIVNTLASPTTIPDPFGTIYKVGRIGVLTATTLAQISAIQKAQAEKGKLVDGEIRGQTHSDGLGVFMGVNGQFVIAEHGEMAIGDGTGGIAIINKRSAAAFKPQLKAAANSNFPGKRQWLSDVNSYKNWGITYAQAGASITPNLTSFQPGPGGGTQTIVVQNAFDEENIEMLAGMVAKAVEKGASDGVMTGVNEANREAERQERLRERTGI